MARDFPHLGARVSYDGSAFSGFQRQAHRHSIQAELERAFSTVFGRPTSIQFASRTDSGVHALDQWIFLKNGLSLISPKISDRLLIALNGVLPPSVRVWQLLRLREDFHPKFTPRYKEYRFRIIQGPTMPPLERASAVWIRRDLDIAAIKKALRQFVGDHDFAAFSKRNRRYGDRTRRRILKAEMRVRPFETLKTHQEIQFDFRGEGFLHHMVRTMLGTLIDIGDGKPDAIRDAFLSRKRSDAGVNAPAHGLTLRRIYVPRVYWREFNKTSTVALQTLPCSIAPNRASL